MRKFLQEVKRRNVFRVGLMYIFAAWLTIQVVDVMFPALNVPEWVVSAVAVLLLIGFPFALIFAWAFEMTPEGIKLEKEVDRSQSITPQTGKKLNSLTMLVLVAAVGFLLVDKFVLQPDNRSEAEEQALGDIRPSIAVLPFVNMSDDKANEYFSDGLAEELLNVLAKIPQLHVAGRTSSFQFKGTNEDLRLIGQKLNVANVLEGSVRQSGAHLRITAQLVDTENGYHLWSNTYDREITDIFAIQDEIAANVVDALRVTLLGEETAVDHGTDNLEAYNLFLQASYFWDQTTAESFSKAEEALRQAIALDPEYARAYAKLANVYQQNVSGFTGDGVEDFIAAFKVVHEYADRALELDPTLADALVAKGLAISAGEWDYESADQYFSRALELVPNHIDALSWVGNMRIIQLRADESIAVFERILQLDPLSISTHRDLGDAYTAARRFDEALAIYRKALRLNPGTARVHGRMAAIFLSRGEFEAAAEEIRQEPVAWNRDMRAIMINSRGQDSAAFQAAAKAYEEQYGVSNSYQLAEIYGYVGDLENTFKWLQMSVDVHDPGLPWLQVSLFLDAAKKDPRWPAMVKLAGL
jgi:serine/threonine-protein kinase